MATRRTTQHRMPCAMKITWRPTRPCGSAAPAVVGSRPCPATVPQTKQRRPVRSFLACLSCYFWFVAVWWNAPTTGVVRCCLLAVHSCPCPIAPSVLYALRFSTKLPVRVHVFAGPAVRVAEQVSFTAQSSSRASSSWSGLRSSPLASQAAALSPSKSVFTSCVTCLVHAAKLRHCQPRCLAWPRVRPGSIRRPTSAPPPLHRLLALQMPPPFPQPPSFIIAPGLRILPPVIARVASQAGPSVRALVRELQRGLQRGRGRRVCAEKPCKGCV